MRQRCHLNDFLWSANLFICQQGLSRLPFCWTRKLLGRAKCHCIYAYTADIRRIKIFLIFLEYVSQISNRVDFKLYRPTTLKLRKLLMSTAENIILPIEGYVLYYAHGLQQRVCARSWRLFAPHKGRNVLWSYESWSAVLKNSVLLVKYYKNYQQRMRNHF